MFRPANNRCLDRRKRNVVLRNITNFLPNYRTVMLLSVLLHITSTSPIGGSFPSPLRRLQITDKKCSYAKEGKTMIGECMFNFECHQRDGKVIGTCIDGFLFGACCSFANKGLIVEGTLDTQLIQNEGLVMSDGHKRPQKYESTTSKPLTNSVNNFIDHDTWVTEIYSVYHLDKFQNKNTIPVNQQLSSNDGNSNDAIPISLNAIESNGETIPANMYVPSIINNIISKEDSNIPPQYSTGPIGIENIIHETSENSDRHEILLPILTETEQSLHLANKVLIVAPSKNSSHWILLSSSATEPTSTLKVTQITEDTIKPSTPSYFEISKLDGVDNISSNAQPSTELFYHQMATTTNKEEYTSEETTTQKVEDEEYFYGASKNVSPTGQQNSSMDTASSTEATSALYRITHTTKPVNDIISNDIYSPNVMPIISQLQDTNGANLSTESSSIWTTTTNQAVNIQSTDEHSFKNENHLTQGSNQTTEGDLLFWTTRSPLIRQSTATTREEVTMVRSTTSQPTTSGVPDTTVEDTILPIEDNNLIQNLIKESSPLTTPSNAAAIYDENLITNFVEKTSFDQTFNFKTTSSLPLTTEYSESANSTTSKPHLDVNMLIQLLNLTNYVPEVGYVIPSSLIIPSMSTELKNTVSSTESISVNGTNSVDSTDIITGGTLHNETLMESSPTSEIVSSDTTIGVMIHSTNNSEEISYVSSESTVPGTVEIRNTTNWKNTTESYVEATSTRADLITLDETTTQPQFNWDWRTTCGVRPLVRQGRIVNGRKSDFGEWPWQALIRESTWLGIFTKNKCGGVLLTEKYVLTAAHCQPGFLASLIVILGELDVGGDYEPKRSVQRNVRKVIVHRDFIARTFDNDLALLELEKPVKFDEHILPICLPQGHDDFVGKIGFVSGWGRLSYQGEIPQKLHNVEVPVVPNKECQDWFREAGHSKVIKPEFICAGYKLGKRDSCEGDSGGPLSMRAEDGRWFLAGIVSHGIKCAFPNLPGVYMRMTYYRPWIEQVISR